MATTTKTYTTSNTWICPPGVTSITVKVRGAGGGGGGVAADTNKAAGGGAGGQYADKVLSVTPGTSYTVNVGFTGGSAGAATGGNGGTGADSWFGSISTVIAKGGAGGQSFENGFQGGVGSTTGGIGDHVFAGGNGGGGGSFNGSGGGGEGGRSNATGGNGGNGSSGVAGTAGTGGDGGDGSVGKLNAAGGTGTIPGGGGSGGSVGANTTNRAGGAGGGGQIDVVYTTPKVENLTDNFNDNSLDSTKWTLTTGGSTTFAETNGRSEITFPASATAASIAEVDSLETYDFTGSFAFLKFVTVPSSATSADAEMRVQTDPSNFFRWVYEAGTLYAQQMAAGTRTTYYSVSFDPTVYSWVKISESGGNVTWWTSADGITWVSRFSRLHGATVTSMKTILLGDCFEVETNPGQFIYDSFNVTPSSVSSLVDNFDDNSIDATKWTVDTDGTGTVQETNQRIEITLTPSTAASYGQLLACNASFVNNYYNLTASSALIKVVQVASGTNPTTVLRLDSAITTNRLEMYHKNGTLFARKTVAGTATDVASISYNATTMLWWRIMESGGSIFWDYSADANSWTNLWNETTPIVITDLTPQLQSIEGTSDASAGKAIFDNFNFIPNFSKSLIVNQSIKRASYF